MLTIKECDVAIEAADGWKAGVGRGVWGVAADGEMIESTSVAVGYSLGIPDSVIP